MYSQNPEGIFSPTGFCSLPQDGFQAAARILVIVDVDVSVSVSVLLLSYSHINAYSGSKHFHHMIIIPKINTKIKFIKYYL
jgi:hypothetical protein